MRFMMMVKANKDSEAGRMPSEELLSAMGKYNEQLMKAGVLLDLAILVRTVGRRRAFRPLNGLFPRLHLDDPVPANDFLGLAERPVHHRGLSSRELDARALRGRL